MCSDPKTFNGYEVSCRECDECVATYKNSWVSRCMAEKQSMLYAYAITLTYEDLFEEIDGEVVKVPPLGARVYRYKDVCDFWKRLRAAAKRRWKLNIDFRYVVVGEKGTKNGRCHYHGVIFSSHPILELGEFTSAKGGGFAYKRRLDWTLWGHGFVEFQRADRDGISYCLKYILKARMTASRSEGYGREGKTEYLASSYLWCSKKPAIGSVWLWENLNDLISKGVCPPALRIRVPGGGDWFVDGKLQKEVCLFLREANNEFREKRGRNLAGWSTLLESVEGEIENSETGEISNRKSWEWLINGEEIEENTKPTPEQIEADKRKLGEWYARKRRIAAPITNARADVRNCGNIKPCDACGAALGVGKLADIEQEYLLRFDQWKSSNPQGSREPSTAYETRFKEWWLTRLRPSRGCGIRNTELLQEQFRKLIPVTKAQHGLAGKAAIGKALQEPPG